MGGALAQPVENLPKLFQSGTIFARYPFLLPNLVCTVVLTAGVIVGVLFLEETHQEMKNNTDFGLEIGRCILRSFDGLQNRIRFRGPLTEKRTIEGSSVTNMQFEEEELPQYTLSDGPELPGYRTTDGTPRQSSSRSQSPGARGVGSLTSIRHKRGGAQQAFNKQVVLAIGAFGILA